jgi:hypothetical protein
LFSRALDVAAENLTMNMAAYLMLAKSHGDPKVFKCEI